jgi:potassium efflux system protein
MIRLLDRGAAYVTALITVLVLCASAVFAQDLSGVDMEKWRALEVRAEAAVDTADTSDETLDELRSELVVYRGQFNIARGANATRIASLRDQITLLGSPSEVTGAAPEAAEIVEKRTELEEQLATLNAPVQVADSAFTSADGLVGEIDAELRNRQAEALLEVVETPLNPVHWPGAIEELRTSISKLWVIVSPDQSVQRSANLLRNLPVILFAAIAGLILIVRGRRWSKMIVERLRQSTARGLGVWQFVVSLLRIVFPLVGLSLWAYAARSSGYLGDRGDQLIVFIPILGASMLGFRWVAEQVFAREEDDALIALNGKDRAQARFYVGCITVLLVMSSILQLIIDLEDGSVLTKTIISFPFTVLIAHGLFMLGRLLRRFGAEPDDDDTEETARASTLGRLIRSIGTITIAVAIAAPLSQAAGFMNASTSMLFPTVLTLVLLGLVLTLQRFSADVYGAITGQGKQARDALLPIFFGMILLLCALPVLALVWGARVVDLTEIWSAFHRGFAVGDARISPTDFITFAVIFTIGYLATRLAQGALKTNVLPKTKIDKGGQNAIVSGLGYVGIFLAALAAITGAGIDLSSLAIVAGALSVGIGFGLQNIVSNFVSGIILLIERPISEGDWIEVSSGQMGYVRDISVRSTRIETFDRTDVIVPNADLVSGTVTNYTRGNTLGRVIIPVGVAYGTDTRKVERILSEIANAQPMALANPAPSVLFVNFGASSLDFEIRMFLRDVNWMMSVKSDVNHAIAERFVQEGIEIPFPQQDVWLRNPESLRESAQMQPAPKASETEVDASDALGDELPSVAAKGEAEQ